MVRTNQRHESMIEEIPTTSRSICTVGIVGAVWKNRVAAWTRTAPAAADSAAWLQRLGNAECWNKPPIARMTMPENVLTETTADFGFALVMAIARRMTESEHFLRAGKWDRWRYDMFAGAEVHGSTLGILGMGRIGQRIARRGAGPAS